MKPFKQLKKTSFTNKNRKTIEEMINTGDAFKKFVGAVTDKYTFEDDELQTFKNLSLHLDANNVVLNLMLKEAK